uniref:Uncharacterized protein n=1 Tax=Rhodnius prolixus TaxID=13249 RepID=T1HY10_RHOPR
MADRWCYTKLIWIRLMILQLFCIDLLSKLLNDLLSKDKDEQLLIEK